MPNHDRLNYFDLVGSNPDASTPQAGQTAHTMNFRSSFFAVVLMSIAALVSGCAGTAKGVKTATYGQQSATPIQPQQTDSESSALVIIRYPALIHAEAETIYVSSFASKAIGGDVPLSMHSNPQTARTAHGVISKSSYYAMSLYRELRDSLPEGKVLLSPHMVDWNQEQGFHSRPILASEQVPTVLTIDFSVYSFPDVTEMMESPPVTFGDLVTPLLVVRTSNWGEPALNGVLIASDPLVDTAWRQARVQMAQDARSRLLDPAKKQSLSLAFIDFLNERDQPLANPPLRSASENESSRLAIERYPVEKIQMDASLVEQLDLVKPGALGANDPFARDFARGATRRLVGLLGGIDHQRATFFARQAAIARFDPELANVFYVQSSDESVRARLQLAEALIAAEREFLSAQSDSVYAGSFDGDYGARMRKIISAEYRMLEERRRLARVQNIGSAIAAIALAGSVYAATVTTTASATAVAAFAGVSLMGSIWALNRALDAGTESEEVNEYFVARMAHATERQMSVQMEWLESKELITARGFAEFRNKTLTLYQSRVRSLAVTTSDHCVFRHPQASITGRWFGNCDEGLATGKGYGLIDQEDGTMIEYLGQSSQGLASGNGAMVVHRDNTEFLEGDFEQGVPNGVVLVERPGAAPRLRNYRNGEDSGRGDSNDWKPVSYATISPGS